MDASELLDLDQWLSQTVFSQDNNYQLDKLRGDCAFLKEKIILTDDLIQQNSGMKKRLTTANKIINKYKKTTEELTNKLKTMLMQQEPIIQENTRLKKQCSQLQKKVQFLEKQNQQLLTSQNEVEQENLQHKLSLSTSHVILNQLKNKNTWLQKRISKFTGKEDKKSSSNEMVTVNKVVFTLDSPSPSSTSSSPPFPDIMYHHENNSNNYLDNEDIARTNQANVGGNRCINNLKFNSSNSVIDNTTNNKITTITDNDSDIKIDKSNTISSKVSYYGSNNNLSKTNLQSFNTDNNQTNTNKSPPKNNARKSNKTKAKNNTNKENAIKAKVKRRKKKKREIYSGSSSDDADSLDEMASNVDSLLLCSGGSGNNNNGRNTNNIDNDGDKTNNNDDKIAFLEEMLLDNDEDADDGNKNKNNNMASATSINRIGDSDHSKNIDSGYSINKIKDKIDINNTNNNSDKTQYNNTVEDIIKVEDDTINNDNVFNDLDMSEDDEDDDEMAENIETNANDIKNSNANDIKNSNANDIKNSNANDIKNSNANDIKNSNANVIKNSNANDIKDSNANNNVANNNGNQHIINDDNEATLATTSLSSTTTLTLSTPSSPTSSSLKVTKASSLSKIHASPLSPTSKTKENLNTIALPVTTNSKKTTVTSKILCPTSTNPQNTPVSTPGSTELTNAFERQSKPIQLPQKAIMSPITMIKSTETVVSPIIITKTTKVSSTKTTVSFPITLPMTKTTAISSTTTISPPTKSHITFIKTIESSQPPANTSPPTKEKLFSPAINKTDSLTTITTQQLRLATKRVTQQPTSVKLPTKDSNIATSTSSLNTPTKIITTTILIPTTSTTTLTVSSSSSSVTSSLSPGVPSFSSSSSSSSILKQPSKATISNSTMLQNDVTLSPTIDLVEKTQSSAVLPTVIPSSTTIKDTLKKHCTSTNEPQATTCMHKISTNITKRTTPTQPPPISILNNRPTATQSTMTANLDITTTTTQLPSTIEEPAFETQNMKSDINVIRQNNDSKNRENNNNNNNSNYKKPNENKDNTININECNNINSIKSSNKNLTDAYNEKNNRNNKIRSFSSFQQLPLHQQLIYLQSVLPLPMVQPLNNANNNNNSKNNDKNNKSNNINNRINSTGKNINKIKIKSNTDESITHKNSFINTERTKSHSSLMVNDVVRVGNGTKSSMDCGKDVNMEEGKSETYGDDNDVGLVINVHNEEDEKNVEEINTGKSKDTKVQNKYEYGGCDNGDYNNKGNNTNNINSNSDNGRNENSEKINNKININIDNNRNNKNNNNNNTRKDTSCIIQDDVFDFLSTVLPLPMLSPLRGDDDDDINIINNNEDIKIHNNVSYDGMVGSQVKNNNKNRGDENTSRNNNKNRGDENTSRNNNKNRGDENTSRNNNKNNKTHENDDVKINAAITNIIYKSNKLVSLSSMNNINNNERKNRNNKYIASNNNGGNADSIEKINDNTKDINRNNNNNYNDKGLTKRKIDTSLNEGRIKKRKIEDNNDNKNDPKLTDSIEVSHIEDILNSENNIINKRKNNNNESRRGDNNIRGHNDNNKNKKNNINDNMSEYKRNNNNNNSNNKIPQNPSFADDLTHKLTLLLHHPSESLITQVVQFVDNNNNTNTKKYIDNNNNNSDKNNKYNDNKNNSNNQKVLVDVIIKLILDIKTNLLADWLNPFEKNNKNNNNHKFMKPINTILSLVNGFSVYFGKAFKATFAHQSIQQIANNTTCAEKNMASLSCALVCAFKLQDDRRKLTSTIQHLLFKESRQDRKNLKRTLTFVLAAMALWPEALNNNNDDNKNSFIGNNVNNNNDDTCLKLVLKYFMFDDATLSQNKRFTKIKCSFEQLSDWGDASTDVSSTEALMEAVLKRTSNHRDIKRCILLICGLKGPIWTINHAIVNVLWDSLSRWVQTIQCQDSVTTSSNGEIQELQCHKSVNDTSKDWTRGETSSKAPTKSADEGRVCTIIDLLGLLSSRHHREMPVESRDMLLTAMHALMTHLNVSMEVREASMRSLVRMAVANEEEEEDGGDADNEVCSRNDYECGKDDSSNQTIFNGENGSCERNHLNKKMIQSNKIDQSFISSLSSLSSSSSSFLQPIKCTLTEMMTTNHNLRDDTIHLIRRVFKL